LRLRFDPVADDAGTLIAIRSLIFDTERVSDDGTSDGLKMA
jgi:hypothetical protein